MAMATAAQRPAAKAARAPMARAAPKSFAPFGGALQAKLALGPANDGYERQADAAAAHVLAGRAGPPALTGLPGAAAPAVTQRACAACEEREKAPRVQRKCACGGGGDTPCSCADRKPEEEHPELQVDRKAKAALERAGDPLGAVGDVVRGPGRPLPDPVRKDMEAGFGRPFGHIRVHDGPRAAASAEAIGAHAYTVGNHIAFNRGMFRPGTDSGRFLLAHELAHTVQQTGAPPAPGTGAISRPGDRHEAQADRAAGAVTTGAPLPALTGGAAPIGRYGAGDLAGDAAEAALWGLGGPVAGYLFGDDVNEAASGAAESAIDFGSDVYKAAVALAEQLGVSVSVDGTTLVIDFEEFDPCSALDIDFALRLSDIGLDPSLYFPLGPPLPFFTVGIVTLAGMAGIEVNLDPGLGLRADQCSFGPGQIRIDALSGSASLSGMLSFDVTAMNQLGADIGLALDTVAIIAWPDPPIVLAVPVIGLSLGGAFEFMLQSNADFTAAFTASASLGGASGAFNLDNDLTMVMDMSYGLYGAVSILGQDLCRLGWPLDSWHEEASVNISVAAAAALGRSGLSFSFAASATPLPTDPLGDLGFAFDDSRMEDDCWLCQFLTDMNAMPSQNGYTWAGNLHNYTLLGGPEHDIFMRAPPITSGSLCRGTCGEDCAPGAQQSDPRPLTVCETIGDRHVWHTYVGYQEFGSHAGCRDHDACYDMMADSIWGFGGYMIGPGYRACDLDAICRHGFQTSYNWSGGGGPQPDTLRYADRRDVTPGCYGPCPVTAEGAEGEAVEQTCLQDRAIWDGVADEVAVQESIVSGNLGMVTVPVPFIEAVNVILNGDLSAAGSAFYELGPINLQNACLIHDPATMTYTGTADLSLVANLGAKASITGTLDAIFSDAFCLVNWVTFRGWLSAGIVAQLPTELTAGVDLYCEGGQLTILPRASFETCLDVTGKLDAGLNVYLLSFDVWGKEWTLAEGSLLQTCWDMDLTFDPFRLGEMPEFDFVTAVGALDALLDEMLPVAELRDIDRTPARSPLPAAPSLLFPCLDGSGGGDDDDDDDGPTNRTCEEKATGADGRRIHPLKRNRGPRYTTATMSIPDGGSSVVGIGMEAPFLENSFVPDGSETDASTQMSIYRHVGFPMSGCFKNPATGNRTRFKATQTFVRGHLLNGGIGGPGNDPQNLFPITQQANKNHEKQVEQRGLKVVEKVSNDELTYYKVTVTGDHRPREITNPSTGVGRGFYEVQSSFLCEVADYNICTDGTLRKNPSEFATVNQDFVFAANDPFDQIAFPESCHDRGPL